MDYIALNEYLFAISDKKFADFSKSLSNSEYVSIGVKNPILRQIIKEHKDDSQLRLEDFKLGQYLEIDFIYFGLALSRLKSVDEQLEFIKNNIHLAKSWAITDCVTTFLRKFSFDKYWNLFLYLSKSKYTYDRRMAYILGLKFYKDKAILRVLKYISFNDEYMVMMAEAWLLATIAIIYEDEIYNFLANCKDLSLKRKTISKISDSFRFSTNSKDRFKALR